MRVFFNNLHKMLFKVILHLGSWLLLLSHPQRSQRDTSDFDNLESDTRNISDRVTRSAKSGNQDLIVFVNEVEAAIRRNECRDLFAVFDELHSNTFSNGRVRLFRLDS